MGRSLLTAGLGLFLAGCGSNERFREEVEQQHKEVVDMVVWRVSTPRDAFAFVNHQIVYVSDRFMLSDLTLKPEALTGTYDDVRSLEWTLKYGIGDCDDFAVASAALLRDNGYPGKLLLMRKLEKDEETGRILEFAHGVHLLERNEKYGAIGQGKRDTATELKFDNISEMILSWSKSNFEEYKVIDLDAIAGLDYVHGKGNLYDLIKPVVDNTPWESVESGSE